MPEAEYKHCNGEPEIEFADRDAFIVCRRLEANTTYLYVWTDDSDGRWAHARQHRVNPVELAKNVRDAYEDAGVDGLLEHHSSVVATVGRALTDD